MKHLKRPIDYVGAVSTESWELQTFVRHKFKLNTCQQLDD
jgi:hypothetical protein